MEDEVKRSRFITTAGYVAGGGEFKEFLTAVRGEFPDAAHNCWAFLIGPPGSTRANGSSDDGEPAGTAGRPMLSVLLNSGVGDIAVVVTRYFGGVKLGKGGLVRAYSAGVRRVLKDMPLSEHVEYVGINIRVEYAAVESIRRNVSRYEGVVGQESFGTLAELHVRIPVERAEDFKLFVLDSTNGKAEMKVSNEG